MTIGEEKILAKYQKNADSPVLDLVANAVGEAFLRQSPVVVSLAPPYITTFNNRRKSKKKQRNFAKI